MWQTKYAWAVPKKLGLGFDFWPYSEGTWFPHWAYVVRGAYYRYTSFTCNQTELWASKRGIPRG